MQPIYLDYAAATPVDDRVLAAMQPYFSDVFYNPSALYDGARQAKDALEKARHTTAQLIGAKPSEVIFTAGGTESANLAIHGVMQQYPEGELIISAVEHEAVLRPAEQYPHQKAPVSKTGRVLVDDLLALVTDKTVLISVMLANNEVGTVQPVKEIVEHVKQIRQERLASGNSLPLLVHTDACQAPLFLDVHVARLGVDLMTLNGGKMHGPKQSGILFLRAGTALQPVISGGGQEWGLRSGTENVAFAVGFAKALQLADEGRHERARSVAALRDAFMQRLEERLNAEITGDRKHRIANNVHAVFPGTDNERVLFALDDAGVAAAAGSACSASKDTASHVLQAMGLSEEDARSSVRFSLGQETTQEQLDQTLEALAKALTA